MKIEQECTIVINKDEARILANFFKMLSPDNVCKITNLYESHGFVRNVLNTTSDFIETYNEIIEDE